MGKTFLSKAEIIAVLHYSYFQIQGRQAYQRYLTEVPTKWSEKTEDYDREEDLRCEDFFSIIYLKGLKETKKRL